MGFGNLATSTSDAPHPLFSPRLIPQKRPLDFNEDDSSDAGMPCKAMKIKARYDAPPLVPACLEEKTTGLMLDDDSPMARSTSAGSSSAPRAEEEVVVPVLHEVLPSCVACPSSEDGHSAGPSALDNAVDAAMTTFMDAWYAFALERDGAKNKDADDREDHASKVSEAWAAERYEQMKGPLLGLLPWLGPMQDADTNGRKYQVVEFQGRKPPHQKGEKDMGDDEILKPMLEWLRNEPRGRAWEALCAVMAALSTRKEKCWLEAHETCGGLEERLSKMPMCKSKTSLRRKQAIRTSLEEEKAGGCSFFAEYLVHASGHLRVAFAQGPSAPIPACVCITARLPLWEALKSLDDQGPLRGVAASKSWCMQAGRQFAFQTAVFGVKEDSKQCRADATALKPDPKLRDLLRSRQPVVVLEIVAALAPRDVMRKEGLSEIVKAELAMVMSTAKSRGEAVIFCLGSDCPHDLASKVYVKPPISDHGLQCGYMRWRESAEAPWARERKWDDRITMCMQMP